MEIFSIFWLKDMKSALKNESKDTGCKNRDWNQGRSDFKPLCGGGIILFLSDQFMALPTSDLRTV